MIGNRMSLRSIGPVYAHRSTPLFSDDRLDAMVAAADAHPGGFEFAGARWHVVSATDALRLQNAYTVVAPCGRTIHVQRLEVLPAAKTPLDSSGSARELAAAAAERRADAWNKRLSKRARR